MPVNLMQSITKIAIPMKKNKLSGYNTPVTMNKRMLCEMLGAVSPKGQAYYSKLRSQYIDDDVLSEIGMSKDRWNEVRGGKHFTVAETRKILWYLFLAPSPET